MTTLTHRVQTRKPLVARWELVTDERGRTRPQLHWELADEHDADAASAVTLVA